MREPVKVLMAPELMEEWLSRDFDGNRLRWDWGEPDADGFHTPTITVDYDDNIAAAARADADALAEALRWPDCDGMAEAALAAHDAMKADR